MDKKTALVDIMFRCKNLVSKKISDSSSKLIDIGISKLDKEITNREIRTKITNEAGLSAMNVKAELKIKGDNIYKIAPISQFMTYSDKNHYIRILKQVDEMIKLKDTLYIDALTIIFPNLRYKVLKHISKNEYLLGVTENDLNTMTLKLCPTSEVILGLDELLKLCLNKAKNFNRSILKTWQIIYPITDINEIEYNDYREIDYIMPVENILIYKDKILSQQPTNQDDIVTEQNTITNNKGI